MSDEKIIESYSRLKNLKLTGQETGIPWQTVYVRLKANNVAVVGDKSRYGSDKDRLAAMAEREFKSIVPDAINSNEAKFQSKTDFVIFGMSVDIKSSLLHRQSKISKSRRWAFSVSKQESVADFVVMFAYSEDGSYRLLLAPGELVKHYQTITIGERFNGKWSEFEVGKDDLSSFFRALKKDSA